MECTIKKLTDNKIPGVNYLIRYRDGKYDRTLWVDTFDIDEIKKNFSNLPDEVMSGIINLDRKIKLDDIL
jgi:hypothetical protein